MSHANYILSQSIDFDKNSIINKFSILIDNIVKQLKTEHLDRIIDSATKYIPIEARNGLIDGIITGRCKSLQLFALTANGQFGKHAAEKTNFLTLNEQLFLLAHMNLVIVNPKIEQLNSEFIKVIHLIIRSHFA